MVNVFFDKESVLLGHATRGIGYYVRNLENALQRQQDIKLVDQRKDAEVVHIPYFDLFFRALKPNGDTPTVVTVFDVIPLLYPDKSPPGIKGKIALRAQKASLKSVKAVITISETSKKDIVRFLEIPESRIHPIYLAPEASYKKINVPKTDEIIKKYKLPSKFVLYVGDVNYNKNLLTLADACVVNDYPLVIVGKQATEKFDENHLENQPIRHFLGKYSQNPQVVRLGFVPGEDLVKIYNMATIYCQPSYYEGFGLPVLEAMACGTPVVAAKTQALVEITEKSVLFFNPKSLQDLREKLASLWNSAKLKSDYSKKGLIRVKNFSWDKTANETIKIYEKAVL